jgi:hypothetical protein
MSIVFYDNFLAESPGYYPVNWRTEKNCEHPNNLGRVENGEFCLLFHGNKHIPRTPPLRNFTLEFTCAGDTFFSPVSILLFFRYDSDSRTGLCVEYTWGVCGGKTHYAQEEMPQYRAGLFRYDGCRKQNKFTELLSCSTEGFIKNLSVPQRFELNVNEQSVILRHSGKVVLEGKERLPEVPVAGCLAFDRNPGKCRIALQDVRVHSDDILPARRPLSAEIKAQFPPKVNGMLSPFVYHIAYEKWAGMTVLHLKLTGGPSKIPIYPEIDRYRFHEKLVDPYVRIERSDGKMLEKIYLFKGSVGLASYHWNAKCTVMLPADGECPIEREVRLDALPADAKFFIGYEQYTGEDSITLAGGPAESLLDSVGQVEYAGEPLFQGTVTLELLPAGERKIPALIPKDIPMYQAARTFAERNFFYFESEPASMEVKVYCRGKRYNSSSLSAVVTLENVFKEPVAGPQMHVLRKAPVSSRLESMGVRIFTCEVVFNGLKNGVYHARIEIFAAGLKLREMRRAFEVISEDPAAPCPPLASGLPRLYPNILSGTENNHFHPWSPATVDITHYNSGGNNYFKVARDWRVWELLHIYRREWLCVLMPSNFQQDGIDANADMIMHADACLNTLRRHDLWAISRYRDPVVFNSLLEFVSRDDFVPSSYGALTLSSLERREPASGISEEQFRDIVEYHWKSWIMHFSEVVTGRLLPERFRQIRELNPRCAPFQFAAVYPPYGSVYKAGYFPFYFGIDLRAGIDKWLPGPNGFEDYPYSSGYAIARGIYQLASSKMECPGLKLYPEMFGINGETLDPRVVYAHPPYGRSDPPRGFLTKQFYEYSFAAVWFDRNGFSFWKDHGYSLKTWDRENYDEMLKAYAFISRINPLKPMRTGAFAFSMSSCLKHPDYFERDEEALHGGYMINTAEESVAFAYEKARQAGLQAGFVFRLEDAEFLNPSDIGLLVLPPLCGVGDKELSAIRYLHGQGVNLICFEDCGGLEDLFGVKQVTDGKSIQVKNIFVTAAGMSVFPELTGLCEVTNHPLSRSSYTAGSAEVLLAGNNAAPVLVMNHTEYGSTAFFTVPPTVVRPSQARVASYGQESISELINRATESVMRRLSDNFVETTEGKTIAFRDEKGNVHIIVEEDAWPHKGREIFPVVTIKQPGITSGKIGCTHEYAVLNIRKDCIEIMLRLDVNETARISYLLVS